VTAVTSIQRKPNTLHELRASFSWWAWGQIVPSVDCLVLEYDSIYMIVGVQTSGKQRWYCWEATLNVVGAAWCVKPPGGGGTHATQRKQCRQ